MKPKVIVIGHGYTSRLGIIRSLGVAGYPIAVVALCGPSQKVGVKRPKPIDCYSKYVSEYYLCPSRRDVLVDFLITKFGGMADKPILFPDSDFASSTVDLNIYSLNQHFRLPNIQMKQGEVVKWMNKELQKEAAKEIGLNVATGIKISIVESHYIVPDTVQFPCFCKPLATIVGGKLGLRKCNNLDELRDHLDFLCGLKGTIDVLVEEFLEIDQEFALVGFSDGRDVLIPGIMHVTEMAGTGHFGVARNGVVLPVDDFQVLISKFQCLIQKIGFIGVFDIDFLLCQDKYYFDEINFRFGGSGYAISKLGVNLPLMMVESLVSGSYDKSHQTIVSSATYINDRMWLDDWYHGIINTKSFLSSILNCEISFIKDKSDIKPFLAYLVSVCMISIKRVARMVLRRQ